jgi:hypothetical protein
MQDDEGTMNTQSEREMARDNTRLSEELKQQIKVNKTLSVSIIFILAVNLLTLTNFI